MIYDYAVIGAGVSGLTAAVILAKHGYSVALVEKARNSTPLLRGFSRNGVHFDTGFHYTGGLGEGEPLDVIFRYLGVSDDLTSFPFCEQGFDIFRSVREGFEFQFPTGFPLIRERLVAAFPAERQAIDRYLELVRKTCDSMPYLNLEVEFSTDSFMQRLSETSLRETLDALTGNKLLKSVLAMHSVLYGVAPDEIPFILHACIVGNYYLSARGIRGGGLSLAKAFDGRIATLGIDTFYGSRITAINLDSGSVAGVALEDGRVLPCRNCISTLHPALLMELLPEETFRPAYRNRLRNLQETVSALMLFASTETAIPLLAGRNLFFFPDADYFDGKLEERTLEENLLYLTAAYRGEDTVPQGFIGISPASFGITGPWLDSRTGRRPDGYRAFKSDMVCRFREHVARLCPDLGGAIVALEGGTPLTVRDFTGSPLGGLYGVKHMVGQNNPLPMTKVRGLFLAGQGIISPGVMGAVLSALIACGNILGHDRLNEELKACR